jgi:hypothetical protein
MLTGSSQLKWDGLRLTRMCARSGCLQNEMISTWKRGCWKAGHGYFDATVASRFAVLELLRREPAYALTCYQYADVCHTCWMHESQHSSGRCLLRVGRFHGGDGSEGDGGIREDGV